jgi:glycosyltransferase involved in cell wall biosynthesis
MGFDNNNLKNKKICFIALGAYPLFLNSVNERIIGPDVHSYLLANEIYHSCANVFFIVCDDNNPRQITINGIKIYKIKNTFKNAFLNKLFKSLQIIREILRVNADIYYQAGGVPIIISLPCKIFNKKFIYSIASDWQVDNIKRVIVSGNKYHNTVSFFSWIGNYIDIYLANSIIVQSFFQKKQLLINYGKQSITIKMSLPLPKDVIPEKPYPPIVIWVGSLAPVKQPLLFIQLAQCFPNIQFLMIGGDSTDNKLNMSVKQYAKDLTNLKLLGPVPFNKMDFYYNTASLLINTSIYEGFPNSFIQAWMHYIPVLSLNANPDGILTKYNIGIVSGSFSKLVYDLDRLLKDPKLMEKMGQNARKYAESEHNIRENIKMYINIFTN